MSIENKLITIANNTPKVYERVYREATRTGSTVSIGNASPIEHELGVKVSGKNLFTNELITDSSNSTITKNDANTCTIEAGSSKSSCYQGFCIEAPKGDFVLSFKCLVDNTPISDGRVNCIYIWGRNSTEKGHGPNTSLINVKETGAIDGVEKTFTFNLKYESFKNYKYLQISWYRNVANATEIPENPYKAELWDMQVELGSTATEFTPYTTDFEGAEVSRCGKNLLDTKVIENGLKVASTPLERVEFNGKQCLKSKINSDNQYNGYANYYLPVPAYCFCIEAYSKTYTKSIITLQFENGTSHSIAISNDINDWKKIFSYSKKIVSLSFYFRPTTEDETVYIALDSMCAFLDNSNTDYEPYVCETATADIEGNVEGLTSLYPNMTLIPNNNALTIGCDYRASNSQAASNKYIELQNAFTEAQKTIKDLEVTTTDVLFE